MNVEDFTTTSKKKKKKKIILVFSILIASHGIFNLLYAI